MPGPTRSRAPALSGVLCLLLLAGVATLAAAGAQSAAGRPRVCVRGACFDVEVAVTAEERGRGLMFRKTLGQREGMLFVFPEEGRHGFWMKNTLLELDMVFIGADRRVVDVARRARPCSAEPCPTYAPALPAGYVLEIAGGLAERLGVTAGDLVDFGDPTPSPPPASGTR